MTEETYRQSGITMHERRDLNILEEIVAGLEKLAVNFSPKFFEAPPLIPLDSLSRTGYPDLFPHLIGNVDARPEKHGLALTSAACHHIYAKIADSQIKTPTYYAVEAPCFRNESSTEPGRMRSFRMYEFVILGSSQECRSWRDRMRNASREFLDGLGIRTEAEVATDPFFGRPGKLLANDQARQQLKWELTAEVSENQHQAVASFNHHQRHFGEAFEICGPDGLPVDSACAAFGLDRLLLAVTKARGV